MIPGIVINMNESLRALGNSNAVLSTLGRPALGIWACGAALVGEAAGQVAETFLRRSIGEVIHG